MRSIISGMVVLGCLSSASVVLADGSAENPYVFALPKNHEARDHMKRGVRLYNVQSFEDAIQEFKAGALAEPCATFDYNLGQSYRQLGRYKEALWHYQRFLRNGNPTGEVLDAVNRWIVEMQAQLANPARTMPPTEPAPDTAQPSSPMVSQPTTSQPHAAPQHDLSTRDVTLRDDRGGSVNWIGWSAIAGGVAALGTTGFLFLRAASLDDQANKRLEERTRNDLHDQAGTRRLAGAIVGAGGLALTAAGVYMLVAHSHRQDRPTTASIDIGTTGHGIVVFGRF